VNSIHHSVDDIQQTEKGDFMSTEETQEDTVEQTEAPMAVSTPKSAKMEGFMSHRDELPTSATIAERQQLRSEMESEIEAFLKGGGKIDQIEPNVMADPPKKPESNYGSRPI